MGYTWPTSFWCTLATYYVRKDIAASCSVLSDCKAPHKFWFGWNVWFYSIPSKKLVRYLIAWLCGWLLEFWNFRPISSRHQSSSFNRPVSVRYTDCIKLWGEDWLATFHKYIYLPVVLKKSKYPGAVYELLRVMTRLNCTASMFWLHVGNNQTDLIYGIR